MKKNLKLIIPAAILVIALTGCGGTKKKEINVDVQKVADDLNATITSEQLTATDPSMIQTNFLISADDYANGAAYMSAGSTANEVAVIECKDEKAAENVEKVFEQRKKDRSELFASYNEGEVKKLDKAVIESEGKYAVWCVSDDPAAAEKVLDGYGF